MLIAKNNPLRPSSIDSNWQEYNEDFQYNLGTVEGKITLYAWFMDDFGNITENIVKASTTYDKTAPTTDTPTLTVTGPYVIVTSNQTDKISTKEYLESTMRYGYRKATGGVVDESTFTWVSNKLINSLENRNTYEFVTKATDEAGNMSISGIAIAEVNYDITIKFDLTGGNGSFLRSSDGSCP